MLGRTDRVCSSGEESEYTVFRSRKSTGIEAYVEVCESSLLVDRGGLVMMDEDVHGVEGAIRGGVFNGEDEVVCQGG